MHAGDLANIQSWFEGYTRSFLSGDRHRDGPLVLKIDHTRRVRSNMQLLAQSIGFGGSRLRMSEAVGLLHDAGRFDQYRRYGTFIDSRSVNHAALGIAVIERHGILDALADTERDLIVEAVRFHNAPALPSSRPPLALAFMRLIRDADKLDIWKVFGDYHRRDQAPEAIIVQHLSDQPTWETAIIEAIMEKKMARFAAMQSITDFTLVQLSWVFDLTYPEAFVQAKQRGDLAVLVNTLPKASDVKQAATVVMDYVDERATCPQSRIEQPLGRNARQEGM